MSNFPIVHIPDPRDDGFEEPVCEECCGTGIVKIFKRKKNSENYYVQEYRCDCQREEEDG